MLVIRGYRGKGSGFKGGSSAKEIVVNLNPCQRFQCADWLVNRSGRWTGLALRVAAQSDRGRTPKTLFIVGRESTHMDKTMV